jgi:predicted DCC family thiol-disulfide oxidoreductase YuxK
MGTDSVLGHKSVVFFDGVCNLCNASVNFIIDRDPEEKFLFASLQSKEARIHLDHQIDLEKMDSILLLKEGKLYAKSDAALSIASELRGGWKYLSWLRWLPLFLRNGFYDLIARYRYRWFGKSETCRIPTPEIRQRFLDSYQVS